MTQAPGWAPYPIVVGTLVAMSSSIGHTGALTMALTSLLFALLELTDDDDADVGVDQSFVGVVESLHEIAAPHRTGGSRDRLDQFRQLVVRVFIHCRNGGRAFCHLSGGAPLLWRATVAR